jgi:GxxExxY protein
MLHEEITHSIIGSCFDVHRELGYGFREYIYVRALERDLIRKGHKVEREVWVTVYFRGEVLAKERMDMLVDGKVLVESKAGLHLDPEVHESDLLVSDGDRYRGRLDSALRPAGEVLSRSRRESVQGESGSIK